MNAAEPTAAKIAKAIVKAIYRPQLTRRAEPAPPPLLLELANA